MKLPSFKRLFKTDYETEFQNLVEQLSLSLNSGIETLYNLGNKQISLRDNILCTVKDVEFTVDANGTPTSTVGIALDVSGRVDGITVIRAENTTNSNIYPTGQPFISFSQNGNTVLINNIKGLSAGSKWRIRVIAWQS